jgi:chaperonin GroES
MILPLGRIFQDQGRHHHPRHRQGKAAGRRRSSPSARRPRRSGKLVPLDVKAGDRVLFGKWSGTEVKLDGEDLLIMKETDIMGVIG